MAARRYCLHLNCNRTSLEQTFPLWAIGDDVSTEPFLPEYAQAMASHPTCLNATVSSDGWFFANPALMRGQYMPPEGSPWPSMFHRDLMWLQQGATSLLRVRAHWMRCCQQSGCRASSNQVLLSLSLRFCVFAVPCALMNVRAADDCGPPHHDTLLTACMEVTSVQNASRRVIMPKLACCLASNSSTCLNASVAQASSCSFRS